MQMNADPSQFAGMPQSNTNPPLRARDPQYQADGVNVAPTAAAQQQQAVIPNGAHQQPQPKAAPRPPPVEEKKTGWSCPKCTFINRPRRPGCEQCGEARPDSYVVPEDCPIEDFERQALENERKFAEVSQAS